MEVKPELLALGRYGEEDVGGHLPVGAGGPVEVVHLLVRFPPRRLLLLQLRRSRGSSVSVGGGETSLAGGGGGGGEEAAEGG